MLKVILETIKTYVGAIMAVIGLATFIWAAGIKSERKDSEKLGMKKDLTEIKIEQAKQSRKMDSVIILINDVKKEQKDLLDNQNKLLDNQNILLVHQNSLRDSWVMWLANQKTLTKEDFIKYMNGIEFQVTPASTTPGEKGKGTDFSISVQPVKPK